MLMVHSSPWLRRLANALARLLVFAAILVFGAGIAGLSYLYWPRHFQAASTPALLAVVFKNGSTQLVSTAGYTLVGVLGAYNDELYAFLMFDYLRSRPPLAGSEMLLHYEDRNGEPVYRIQAICPNDLLACIPWLDQLQHAGLAQEPSWASLTNGAVRMLRQQTALFVDAYSKPVGERFERLSAEQRVEYVRRFLRFKSSTDPRVRQGDSDLQPLTQKQAGELAGDIIAVADFYDLPLEFFLGIGAMENNYLNVPGDLNHAVWKRHADPGDIVLRRRHGRVLVKNFSVGVWQITRETLRFAHSLFLADQRDYSKLPERLRPTRALDIDHVEPAVLTTYAGLLLRHLLDYFHGDVAKAVGAYNGGAGNPNERYESGVRQVAEYARRILGRAAAMKDASIAAIDDPASSQRLR